MARQTRQPPRGTWRPNAGPGTVLRHPPGRPGKGIMADLIFAPGQRINCRQVLAFRRSGAHTGHYVALLQTPAATLLQTPAATKIADPGVKLSAEPPRVVTGVRSVNHAHGVRIRCGRDTSQRGQERTALQHGQRFRTSRKPSPIVTSASSTRSSLRTCRFSARSPCVSASL